MFGNSICHGLVISYTNIYLKEGTMQHIVLIININLTIDASIIFNTFIKNLYNIWEFL